MTATLETGHFEEIISGLGIGLTDHEGQHAAAGNTFSVDEAYACDPYDMVEDLVLKRSFAYGVARRDADAAAEDMAGVLNIPSLIRRRELNMALADKYVLAGSIGWALTHEALADALSAQIDSLQAA